MDHGFSIECMDDVDSVRAALAEIGKENEVDGVQDTLLTALVERAPNMMRESLTARKDGLLAGW